eukprot:CAMPEP_0172444494 /NCGR_PEP_ID=MMETSP1065-20121228/4521_1 /TAXON_ID=265537 /ORGANISM="Amphiprora paludosa, Strain CCMP125" /LENGTH=90 /DNA_ID=CAMNT_0013195039 /DNA_START=251 /DNA_END=523 /DNA_ORIENTATION=+
MIGTEHKQMIDVHVRKKAQVDSNQSTFGAQSILLIGVHTRFGKGRRKNIETLVELNIGAKHIVFLKSKVSKNVEHTGNFGEGELADVLPI